jgi:hypothetical protein
MPRQLISLEEAVDQYDSELDEYIQESVWESSGFCEDRAAEMLDQLAKDNGQIIDWNNAPTKLLWDIYCSTEKGLS